MVKPRLICFCLVSQKPNTADISSQISEQSRDLHEVSALFFAEYLSCNGLRYNHIGEDRRVKKYFSQDILFSADIVLTTKFV